jgi:DNA polymerase III subunit epsilon
VLAPAIAFVDLETTGTTATADRITEVGIVRVLEGELVEEWSSLVDPETSIPPAIQALTGITNAMVASAPTFAQIAGAIRERLADHLFVAHNARFDYGFLKNEFARLGETFSAKVLCTVRLSRHLYPQARHHNLDSLIQRHGLNASGRHRALGDARMLWQFVQVLRREHPAEDIQAAVDRLLKTPSMPPQLAPNALEQIPEAPGVYYFYGLNRLPIYIGKSTNLRERVRSHFSGDHRSGKESRLSTEVQRIEFEQTAGELGALLLESRRIKELTPLHNQRLRRKGGLCALRLALDDDMPTCIDAGDIDIDHLDDLYGVFASRQAARNALHDIAAEHGLCLSRLGLENKAGPCFAYQIRRCRGACVGAEALPAHRLRLITALTPLRFRVWPFPGRIGIREHSGDGGCTEIHVFDRWCWIGTARSEGELGALTETNRELVFDLDIYKIAARFFVERAGRLQMLHLGRRKCAD